MAEKKMQRIKLSPFGNSLKLDATIVEMEPNGRWMKVRFDAPIDDKTLYQWGQCFIDRKLEGEQVPAQFPDCNRWEVK